MHFQDLQDLLLNSEAANFIREHQNEKAADLALKYRNKISFDLIWACEQIEINQKAKLKLPSWVNSACSFTKRAYEQSSAEAVAVFRASLITGNKGIDLTSGLGVDAWALAKAGKSITVVEQNLELTELLKWNIQKLGQQLTFSNETDALTAAENIKKGEFDFVFFDPDRRPDEIKTSILSAYLPNPIEIIKTLSGKVKEVLIKLSPLTDLTALKNEIPSITKVGVITHQNEVKEVLAFIEFGNTNEFSVFVAETSTQTIQFQSDFNVRQKTPIQPIKKYLVEPPLGIIKAGFVQEWGNLHQLHPIGKRNVLLTSAEFQNIPGRWFQIKEVLEFKPKLLKNYFKANKISSANISTRTFFLEPAEIKKVLNLKDGGSLYLFFTTLNENELVCIVTEKTATNLA